MILGLEAAEVGTHFGMEMRLRLASLLVIKHAVVGQVYEIDTLSPQGIQGRRRCAREAARFRHSEI
jgi:hypothetical protein